MLFLLENTRRIPISRIRNKNAHECESAYEQTTFCSLNARSADIAINGAGSQISAALSGLSETQKEAIALAYFDGLTCKEIANRTGASSETVKSRLRAALKRMRESFLAATNSDGMNVETKQRTCFIE